MTASEPKTSLFFVLEIVSGYENKQLNILIEIIIDFVKK